MDAIVKVSPYDIFDKDWEIVGSFAVCYTTLPAITMLENNIINVEPLVNHTILLSDFQSGFNQSMLGQH